MKQIAVIGIDLAKNMFQVHGTGAAGHPLLTKKLSRSQVIEFFAKLTPCLISMEACSSAHYWEHRLSEMGHTVKLMPPQYVKPYVKTNKNDTRDAGVQTTARKPASLQGVVPRPGKTKQRKERSSGGRWGENDAIRRSTKFAPPANPATTGLSRAGKTRRLSESLYVVADG